MTVPGRRASDSATSPAAPDRDPPGGRYRIDDPADILALLQRLHDTGAAVGLSAAGGPTLHCVLAAVNSADGSLVFTFASDAGVAAAGWGATSVTVKAELEQVRLQFDVPRLDPEAAGGGRALRGALPRELFRFQRRDSYRVQPIVRSGPVAQLRHPMIPDMLLRLRVLDLSNTGCALFLPADVPPVEPGVLMNGVRFTLDLQTRIESALRLHYVTSIDPDALGVRLGCELVDTSVEDRRQLRRYVDKTQRLRRLLAPR